MNASAYLTAQGWRGEGHALHHSGRGIAKPLLISQKQNVLGIGKKRHDAHADQWWARAFDDTLKEINTTVNEITGDTQSITMGGKGGVLQMVGNGGRRGVGQGLYSNFVRGESLSGTLTPEEKTSGESVSRIKSFGSEKIEDQRPAVEPLKKRKIKHNETQRIRLEDGMRDVQDMQCLYMETQDQRRLQEKQETKEEKKQRHQRRNARKARRAMQESAEQKASPANKEPDNEIPLQADFGAQLKKRKEGRQDRGRRSPPANMVEELEAKPLQKKKKKKLKSGHLEAG